MSSPTWITFSPAATGRTASIMEASTPRVFSTMTTASAPSGSMPPVWISAASPGASFSPAGCPMATSPASLRYAGRPSVAPWVSSARTA